MNVLSHRVLVRRGVLKQLRGFGHSVEYRILTDHQEIIFALQKTLAGLAYVCGHQVDRAAEIDCLVDLIDIVGLLQLHHPHHEQDSTLVSWVMGYIARHTAHPCHDELITNERHKKFEHQGGFNEFIFLE